jgi:cyclophilin family peptidyl-prolyl cis-trans isomerase
MLRTACLTLSLALLLPWAAHAADGQAAGAHPQVAIETTLGTITVELFDDRAPVSSKNFLDYVNAKFYDGLIFHRVIPNFMVQGGGFTPDLTQKPTRDPIKNEASNGVHNGRGTLAMARTAEPNSATAQFFINVAENNFLDHQDDTVRGMGYAVFGRVVNGMDVVDKIVGQPTTSVGPMADIPVTPVVMKRVQVVAPAQ